MSATDHVDTTARQSLCWKRWMLYNRRVHSVVLEMHATSLKILKSTCQTASRIRTAPLQSLGAVDTSNFGLYQEGFLTVINGMRLQSDLKRIESILSVVITTLQDGCVQCFCPHDLGVVGVDLVAFRSEWNTVQLTCWPDVCSIAHVNIGSHLARLREIMEYVSRHLLAWCNVQHFHDVFMKDDDDVSFAYWESLSDTMLVVLKLCAEHVIC
jgi:hypothetical protein